MDFLSGIKIHTSPLVQPVQKIKVSPTLLMSDSVRDDMNKYLLDTFGMQDVAYMVDLSVFGMNMGQSFMVMNPKHAVLLRDFTT